MTPAELLQHAAAANVSMLAITDHDTLAGYQQALNVIDQAEHANLPVLISGIELSAEWAGNSIHIVGLNFSAGEPGLTEFLQQQRKRREQRNMAIIQRLQKAGLDNILDLLEQQSVDGEEFDVARLGRPHIAAAIVMAGAAGDTKKAFRKYLLPGKPAAVAANWPSIQEVGDVLGSAGGVMVLAHPLHYKLTASKLRRLVADFAAAGGHALEVVSGSQDKERNQQLAKLAADFDLQASVGSDFHSVDKPWQRLGGVADLPKACKPVWEYWGAMNAQ